MANVWAALVPAFLLAYVKRILVQCFVPLFTVLKFYLSYDYQSKLSIKMTVVISEDSDLYKRGMIGNQIYN